MLMAHRQNKKFTYANYTVRVQSRIGAAKVRREAGYPLAAP